MSTPQLIVAPRKTVLLPGNRKVTEGQALPADHGLEMQELDGLALAGYILPFREVPKKAPKQRSQRVKSVRKWNRNPVALLGRTLDELNVLIGEVDATADLASTVEEAVAVLTSEYDAAVDGVYHHANNGGDSAGIKAVSFITPGPEEGEGRVSDGTEIEGGNDPSVPNNEAAEDLGD